MFLGCLPCCGNICDRPYDISPASVDIAATFSFFQSSQQTHGGNTMPAISETFTVDGTIAVVNDEFTNDWEAVANIGSWQHTAYDFDGTSFTNSHTAKIQVAALQNFSVFYLRFYSGSESTYGTGQYSTIFTFYPCGLSSNDPAHRALTVFSRNYRAEQTARYTASKTLLAGSINDSWSTTNSNNLREYTYRSEGPPPQSISLLTDGEQLITYYTDYSTNAASRALNEFNVSVSITRLRLIDANGDYFEPLFNWFSSVYSGPGAS